MCFLMNTYQVQVQVLIPSPTFTSRKIIYFKYSIVFFNTTTITTSQRPLLAVQPLSGALTSKGERSFFLQFHRFGCGLKTCTLAGGLRSSFRSHITYTQAMIELLFCKGVLPDNHDLSLSGIGLLPFLGKLRWIGPSVTCSAQLLLMEAAILTK